MDNSWSGLIQGREVYVAAGGVLPADALVVHLPMSKATGGLALFVHDNQGPHWFPTPIPTHTVRITKASGTVLTLRSSDGIYLRFDAAARRYLSATGM